MGTEKQRVVDNAMKTGAKGTLPGTIEVTVPPLGFVHSFNGESFFCGYPMILAGLLGSPTKL